MSEADDRFHPIIYVRGYAMTQSEIDATTADPFCGFNLGSTVYRAATDKTQAPKKFVFESPVVRLRSDFGYGDVYEDGVDIVDPDWKNASIAARSIVIYRYYDAASALLGTKRPPEMKDFAIGLGALILRVRDLVCADPKNGRTPATFRCYLVAHSMGGLVCRAFLQNPKFGTKEARGCVDKVFTYATPHNGIEMAGINVPSWLTAGDMDNFSRDRMAAYLALTDVFKKTKRVDWLPEDAFPSHRFFCMVGTNRSDYQAAAGVSRTFAGNGSDGLVRIENASVWGIDAEGRFSAPSATAYAYRSHSGYFGIVNSEEAYQNLTRFLFGDVRIDVWVDVDEVRLPAELRDEEKAHKVVNALYQFEFLASPRGKRWYLTRRIAEEDSVACRTYGDLSDDSPRKNRSVFLSTVFLANRARVDPTSPSLAYSITLGIRVPDYEVEKSFWPDKHYEGGYLFRDSLVVEITPPAADDDDWTIKHDWQSDRIGEATQQLQGRQLKDGGVELLVPFTSDGADPGTGSGISGQLRFVVSQWNEA